MTKLFSNKYFIIIVFAILALILIINNWSFSLIDQDEAAYAGFGKTMLETGNYLIPDFMWSEVHRKPPLLFWLITISYKIFGINEFATRLPVGIAVFLVYIIMFFQGKKFFGKETALLSVIILGTSFFVPILGKMAYTDGLLLLFHTIAGFSLLNILINKSYKWVAIFWFSFALGLLTKGPPIMIFTGFLAILLFIFHEKRWNLIILHPWFFLPVALLPLFLWGYQAWQVDNGEFIKWMLDWYILKRVNSSVFGQTGPPGYFLAFFLIFFLPYLTFIPAAFVNAFKSLKSKNKEFLLLLCWLVAGWLFYEFLKSKLPTYAIAAYPALSLMLAKQVIIIIKEKKNIIISKISSIFQLIISIALSIGIIWGAKIYLSNFGFIIATILSIFLITGTTLSIIYFWRARYNKSFLFFIGNATIFLLFLWIFLMPKIDKLKNSTERVADFIQNNIKYKSTIVIANSSGHPPSLPFYLLQKNKFSQVIEEYNEKKLIEYYQSDTAFVFILNDELRQKIIEQIPTAKITEISSFSADRTDMAKYYVLMNEKSK